MASVSGSSGEGNQPAPAAGMRIVYVLSADGPDVHFAMTRVSVASLRVSNPQARIEIVCDENTDGVSRQARDPLRDEVDRWFVQDTPPGSPGYRNRFLKTTLREFLRGSFLYLDGDTFVRADLSPLFLLDTDVAAARNHSADAVAGQIWVEDAETCRRMGWPVGHREYLNGGVIFLADTPEARAFAGAWHRLWLSSVATTRGYRDQPALNTALMETLPRLKVLPHRFNAQIRGNLRVSLDAVIQHYYSSSPGAPTAAQLLAERLLAGAPLRHSEIEAMVRRPHPWRHTSWVDGWFASRIARKGSLNRADELWLTGHRFRSAVVRTLGATAFGSRLLEKAQRIERKLRKESD